MFGLFTKLEECEIFYLSRSRTVDSALAGTFEGGAEHEDSLLNLSFDRKCLFGQMLIDVSIHSFSKDLWDEPARHSFLYRVMPWGS